MPKLTTRKVESLKVPGMHGDGDGLYLRIGPTGGKSWVLRTVVYGNRRDLGIGSASLVTLAEARETARQLRKVDRAFDAVLGARPVPASRCSALRWVIPWSTIAFAVKSPQGRVDN